MFWERGLPEATGRWEALCVTCVSFQPHSQISTGLDSATTHSLVTSLRAASQHQRVTQLIGLLQPPPETVALFDDVLVRCLLRCAGLPAHHARRPDHHLPSTTAVLQLLSAGRVIFHGPTEALQPFFESQLGFACPLRTAVADFVQELSTPEGGWRGSRPGGRWQNV